MLQSIQFCGSGPPTYVYSKAAAGLGNAFFHVFATETRGYDGQQERKNRKQIIEKKKSQAQMQEIKADEQLAIEEQKSENLQEVYQKEYGKRESFLWKQR